MDSIWVGSNYFKSLGKADKAAYKAKLTLSNGETLPNPYALENLVSDVSLFPEVTYPDIYTYLVETPNGFTKESMKAYKSLQAYNFFQCGHVQDILYNDLSDSDRELLSQNKQKFCAMKTMK